MIAVSRDELENVQKRYFQGIYIKCLCFKTNRDEKYCLSSEIEVLEVEKPLKFRILVGNPYVIYIGDLREIRGFWWFFNKLDLYLRAQTIFFITVCFKT